MSFLSSDEDSVAYEGRGVKGKLVIIPRKGSFTDNISGAGLVLKIYFAYVFSYNTQTDQLYAANKTNQVFIVSFLAAGLPKPIRSKPQRASLFIPGLWVLRDKFKGKYLAVLDESYCRGELVFSASCQKPRNSYEWILFLLFVFLLSELSTSYS